MTGTTSIANIRMGGAVALAATLVLAGMLLQPAPAGAQCNPTCQETCNAHLKDCKGAAQRQNKQTLANCSLTGKVGNANCAYLALQVKNVQCLAQCGPALEACKLSGKQSVEFCKLNTKAAVASCKDSAKQSLQQALTDCQTTATNCLASCP